MRMVEILSRSQSQGDTPKEPPPLVQIGSKRWHGVAAPVRPTHMLARMIWRLLPDQADTRLSVRGSGSRYEARLVGPGGKVIHRLPDGCIRKSKPTKIDENH